MAMSKKNFEAAAKIVATHYGAARSEYAGKEVSSAELWRQAEAIREAFVAFFRAEDSRFDADRFRKACDPAARAGRSTSTT